MPSILPMRGVLIAVAMLATAWSSASAAQAVDTTESSKAGTKVVETQKPKAKTAPQPADGAEKSIIIVGGRSGRSATPVKKPVPVERTTPVKAAPAP